MEYLIHRYNNENFPNINYAKSLEVGIRNQLAMFEETEVFIYYSYLVYLLIFFQYHYFENLEICKVENGRSNRVYDPIPWIKQREGNNVSWIQFLSIFRYQEFTLI